MYIAVLNLGSIGLLEGLEGFFGEGGAVGTRRDELGRWAAAAACGVAAGRQGLFGLRVGEIEGEEEEVGVWLVCGHVGILGGFECVIQMNGCGVVS